ncbi:hypothetical protein PTSG_11795 [Salpingoeca rosetta]|uniref:Uncharacterized protein n=1 Tax=Salpingoeca rosetta (strain ATCC 50818 / BSB-021) TaxID=946362 RepID=F2TZ81_SALR5|nr:uncharacterized protein PTSG_11795 [Salpingoeca rosetta]EGD78905.1 hypothetical protein PTSG_11795 [Salpingoeca rosetta]|eukprot:XP_004997861.1 hypothetical protein PTSG_11795 [Salpingoeca rosetta]
MTKATVEAGNTVRGDGLAVHVDEAGELCGCRPFFSFSFVVGKGERCLGADKTFVPGFVHRTAQRHAKGKS